MSKKGIHLQRPARDATIVLQEHTSTGAAPPPSLSIQHGGRRSPVNRSSAEIQAGLNSKCMTALYNYIKGG